MDSVKQTLFSEHPVIASNGVKVPYVGLSSHQLDFLYPAIKKSSGFIFRGGHVHRNHDACGEFRHELECPSCGHKEILRYSCHEMSCPECSDTWMARTAERASSRFNACLAIYKRPQRYIKHVTFSPPQEWAEEVLNRGIDGLKIIRGEFNKILKLSGAKGAVSIFHACRKEHGEWVLSPHFHVLLVGYLKNSDDFFKQTGWIYKAIPNRGKRDVRATMYYQLSHVFYYGDLSNGERIGNYHLVSWHGDFSYNKVVLDSIQVKLESFSCPGCGEAMVEVFDYGSHKRYDDFYIKRKYYWYKKKSINSS